MKKLIAGILTAGALTMGLAAPAQAAIITDGTSLYGKVCSFISDHPTADGVAAVVIGLDKAGYTKDEIAEIVVGAVKTVCPQNIRAVQKFIDKYADHTQTA